MTGMVHDMEPDTRAMKRWAGGPFSPPPTDLAELAGARPRHALPRRPPTSTGRLVAMAEAQKTGLEKLSLAQMQSVEPRITDEIFKVLGVERSVKSRVSYGGTAPAECQTPGRRWLTRLEKEAGEAGRLCAALPQMKTSPSSRSITADTAMLRPCRIRSTGRVPSSCGWGA